MDEMVYQIERDLCNGRWGSGHWSLYSELPSGITLKEAKKKLEEVKSHLSSDVRSCFRLVQVKVSKISKVVG